MSDRSSRRLPFVSVLVLLLGASCAVDQAAEVATYRRVLDGDKPPEVAPFAANDELDLERAMALANSHNETLVLQGEDYLQALIDENRAAAAFLPTVSLNPSFNASHATGGIGTKTQQNLPLDASINLFRGFQDISRMASSAATSEQRRELLLDAQASLMLSVAQTFYQILRSEQSSVVLTSSLKLQAERLRDIRARQKLGIAKPLDVAQTEADEAAAQVALLQADSDARNGRAMIAFLIGVPRVDGKLVDLLSAPETVADLEEFDAEAKANRRDFLASHSAVEAAQHDVDTAFRQHYPSINLSASYIIAQAPSFGSVWNLALSGLIPIFNAGLIHDDVRTAWSRYRQAAASESLLARQISQDVQVAYENFETSHNKVAQLKTEVTAAQRAYDLSDRSYQLGGASNLDRLTAQNTLLTSQLQLTSEQFNLKVFYLDLLRIAGTSLRASP
jgi:outer membrane protein